MPYTPSSDTQLGSCNPAPGGSSVGTPFKLPDTAHILRYAATGDGLGTTTLTPTDLGSVPCRLEKLSGTYERAHGGPVDQEWAVWWCYLDLSTDIRPQDRVTVNGTVFEVTGSDKGMTDATYITAELVEVNRQ